MASGDDWQILQLYATGRPNDGWELLTRNYRKGIQGAVHIGLRSCWYTSLEEEEDLIHEVLEQVDQSLRHPNRADDPVRSLPAWIQRIIQTTVHRYRQKLLSAPGRRVVDGPSGSGEKDELEELLPDPDQNANPEAAAEMRSMLHAVLDCLSAVENERARECVRLWLLGMSSSEIAERLTYTTNGALTARTRALVLIGRCLRAKGWDVPEL